MGKDLQNKFIAKVPALLNTRLQDGQNAKQLFVLLGQIIDFDKAQIYFLNPDHITLKYSNSEDDNQEISINLPEKLLKKLFNKDNIIANLDDELAKYIQLGNSNLIIKLTINDTTFGLLLLQKQAKDFYSGENIEISKAIGSLISYKIKDLELSEIFKTQLQALAQNFVESKNTDKIKTEFFTNVSHELRTPLNAIIGFSEILANGFYGKLNEKQSEFVNDIQISGIHLLGMINEILDMSKLESKAMKLNLTTFKINIAIQEVINTLKPLAEKKNIQILSNTQDETEITADFQKIKQILYNLVSNAIKFSHRNSKIELEISVIENHIYISVKDYGEGIEAVNHKKIFEKFTQIESENAKNESSTGLGLAITKELIGLHKGTITVESELNKGATFIVKLPCFD